MKHAFLFIFSILFITQSYSQRQVDLDKTVQVEINIDEDQNQATLYWDDYEEVQNYFVFKRKYGEDSWGPAQETLFGGDTSYVVENIEKAELYEFKVSRSANSGFAEGYITSGFQVEHNPFGRGLIFVSEASISDTLNPEIQMMIGDIRSEGWHVEHLVVSKDETALNVKDQIISIVNAGDTDYKSILIFGHVPVPYSGIIGPDGHGNHIGAWPCDAYYGDIDGAWSDSFANNTTASQTRNHNVPGDGKFDSSVFASDIDLSVGRIDFANLSVFEESEVELLRRYIMKNHNFRKGIIKAPDRGLIENNFNLAEGFGQNGIKNFTPMFGRDSVHFRDFDALKSESYLWSYGAGGGNFQGASGISNSTNFSNDSIQTIFSMLFGSYFGDWDSDNNFLRSALASGTCLSSAWAGRPNWMFHPMAMGLTLGDCTLISQNNSGEYVTGFGGRQIHIALLGDPTLKMYYPKPAENLEAKDIGGGTVELNWTLSLDTTVTHYFIYRNRIFSGTFKIPEKIAVVNKNTSTYRDSCLQHAAEYDYFVSAVQLKHTASGSSYFESGLIEDDVIVISDPSITSDFSFTLNDLEMTLENTSVNANSWLWDFGDNTFSDEEHPTHVYEDDDIYLVTLIVNNHCFSDTLTQLVQIVNTNVEDLVEYDLKIYPNPVKDILFIDCPDCQTDLSGKIIDLSGNLISKFSNISDSRGINVFHLSQGMYILKIVYNGEIRYIRFSKM